MRGIKHNPVIPVEQGGENNQQQEQKDGHPVFVLLHHPDCLKLEVNKRLKIRGPGLVDQEDQDHHDDHLDPVRETNEPVHTGILPP